MSTKEVDEIKERLIKLEEGFKNFKTFSAQVIRLELNPLNIKLDRFDKHFEKIFEHMESTQVRCTNHSSELSKIKSDFEKDFALHEERTKNKSLGLKLWIISRDAAALTAFCWLIFKEFLSDKIG